jgi:transposase
LIQDAWMPDLTLKMRVILTPDQREQLEAICRRQAVSAALSRRARILLLSDEGHPDGRRPDHEIAAAVGLCERQVVRIRQKFVREGDSALQRKPRPSVPGKLDGVAEAHLVTLCCSPPPEGRDRWTLQLLCDELGRLEIVESVCRETVRKCLKKTRCSRGASSGSASRSRTGPGSSPVWRKSWTSTRRPMTRPTR